MDIISKEEVAHIAELAELAFNEKELEKFTSQLSVILEHINKISRADTKGVEPTSHVLHAKNVFRDDINIASLSQSDALKNAPDESGGGFRVPKID